MGEPVGGAFLYERVSLIAWCCARLVARRCFGVLGGENLFQLAGQFHPRKPKGRTPSAHLGEGQNSVAHLDGRNEVRVPPQAPTQFALTEVLAFSQAANLGEEGLVFGREG